MVEKIKADEEPKKSCNKKKPSSNMYSNVKTWNPFKGCTFDCIYCKPSFQAQAKRQKNRCMDCYNFTPHTHPDRLDKIPSGCDTVFVCGNGDISFCDPKYTIEIINSIKKNNLKNNKTFFMQSKNPKYFQQFLKLLPDNVKLITTLETNRDDGYKKISKAPVPSVRYKQFLALDYPHKVLTIEPIMDFDHEEFLAMIMNINPELVWLGVNSRPKQVTLPTPVKAKFDKLYNDLISNKINVQFMNKME